LEILFAVVFKDAFAALRPDPAIFNPPNVDAICPSPFYLIF
jgi:hypothetical protein